MTDKKISDLTSAGVVNDADTFPMVQSGDTKKATIALMKAAVAPSAATESAAGIIEIANTAEAQSGSNDDRAMTSAKVQDFVDAGIVGDGATGGNQGVGTVNAKGLFVNGEEVSGGAAGMEVIATSTPTGVNSVTFSSIPQTYRGLYLTAQAISGTATSYMIARAYTNGGGTGLTTLGFAIAGTTVSALINNYIWGAPASTTAAQQMAAAFKIIGYQALPVDGGSVIKPRTYQGYYGSANGVTSYTISGSCGVGSSTDTGIDEIIVSLNTGNFDAGTITLYGIL